MNKVLTSLLTIVAVTGLAASAYAAGVKVQAQATVVGQTPLSIRVEQAPDFGAFSVGAEGGSINLIGTTQGDVVDLGGQLPFNVTYLGEPDTLITYSIPQCTLYNENQDSMVTGPVGSDDYGLDENGLLYMSYNGINLFVNGNQPAGDYSGIMILTADY